MVIKKKTTKAFLLFFPAFLFLFSNCYEIDSDRIIYDDEACETYDYADCNTTEPTHADLKIQTTMNENNLNIPVVIFRGYYDKKDTLMMDTLSGKTHTVRLAVGQYYSVLAQYRTSSGIVYALDGARLDKKKQNVCDSVCWREKGGKVDLRLR